MFCAASLLYVSGACAVQPLCTLGFEPPPLPLPVTQRIHLEVRQPRTDGEYAPILLLPRWLSTRLIQFMKRKELPSGDFDCGSFVHYLHRLPYRGKRLCLEARQEGWNLAPPELPRRWEGNPAVWKVVPWSGEELAVGDVLFLLGAAGNFVHAAVYVGATLFLSQLGVNRCVVISELEDLFSTYPGAVRKSTVVCHRKSP